MARAEGVPLPGAPTTLSAPHAHTAPWDTRQSQALAGGGIPSALSHRPETGPPPPGSLYKGPDTQNCERAPACGQRPLGQRPAGRVLPPPSPEAPLDQGPRVPAPGTWYPHACHQARLQSHAEKMDEGHPNGHCTPADIFQRAGKVPPNTSLASDEDPHKSWGLWQGGRGLPPNCMSQLAVTGGHAGPKKEVNSNSRIAKSWRKKYTLIHSTEPAEPKASGHTQVPVTCTEYTCPGARLPM